MSLYPVFVTNEDGADLGNQVPYLKSRGSCLRVGLWVENLRRVCTEVLFHPDGLHLLVLESHLITLFLLPQIRGSRFHMLVYLCPVSHK